MRSWSNVSLRATQSAEQLNYPCISFIVESPSQNGMNFLIQNGFGRSTTVSPCHRHLSPTSLHCSAFFQNLKAIMKEEAAKTNLKQQIEAAKKEIKRK